MRVLHIETQELLNRFVAMLEYNTSLKNADAQFQGEKCLTTYTLTQNLKRAC